MQILAHRGFWKVASEKNTYESIRKAFEYEFGIETDIRDYQGKLVISHNVADGSCMEAEDMFKCYKELGCCAQLALNVKADGIQPLLAPLLQKYQIQNYFLFDMSIPELVVNEREQLKYYTRHSDIERECVMYDKACGVWLDCFYDRSWLSETIIEKHVSSRKRMCIVSPELHGYEYMAVWEMIKKNGYHKNDQISLCTDKPEEARRYFYEQNKSCIV